MKRMQSLAPALTLGILALSGLSANSQSISITAPNTALTENFNSLSSTANTYATGPQPITGLNGWYAKADNARTLRYTVDDGTLNTGSLYNYGTSAASTDRVLGSLSSGGTTTQPQYITYGARFVNNTTYTLNSFDLSFNGLQFHAGGTGTNSVVNTNAFLYKTFAAGTGNLGSDTYTGNGGPVASTGATAGTIYDQTWTRDTDFDNTASQQGTTTGGGKLAPPVSTTISNTLTGLSVDPGQEVWIRWLDSNDAGSDQGLGIDNISITFHSAPAATTPAPSSLLVALVGVPGIGLMIRRRRAVK